MTLFFLKYFTHIYYIYICNTRKQHDNEFIVLYYSREYDFYVFLCLCLIYRSKITWMKDHESLDNKNKKYELNKKGMLRIQDIAFSDSGVYSCVGKQLTI